MVDLKKWLSALRKGWTDVAAVLCIIASLVLSQSAISSGDISYSMLALAIAVAGMALLLLPVMRSKGKDILRTSSISRLTVCAALLVVAGGVFSSSADVASLGFGVFLVGFILMVLS